MSSKELFVRDVRGGMSVSSAAERHGISRSCGYKWMQRYEAFGLAGLQELSRAPEHSPRRTPQPVVDALLALKKRHPDFGPVTLSYLLHKQQPELTLAPSTAGVILDRHGLVKKQRSRSPMAQRTEFHRFVIGGPGQTMTADYKGQFRTGNGAYSYPLTIADPISRYVFAIDAMQTTNFKDAKTAFDRVFRKYGLPFQMLTDNGTPFCSSGSLGGLTHLSKWWIELGIVPIRSRPGHPEDNGIHERMHRTLKKWICRLPQHDRASQQRSFQAFRREFNQVRPHRALGGETPASQLSSFRPYSSRPRAIEYDSNISVRQVRSNGQIKWKGDQIFVSEVLTGSSIGLVEVEEELCSIQFGPVRIGYLDQLAKRVTNRIPERLKAKISSMEEAKSKTEALENHD